MGISLPSESLNYFLYNEYLITIVKPIPKHFHTESKKCYLINYIVACHILSSPVFVNIPSSDTLAYLLSILTFGILT